MAPGDKPYKGYLALQRNDTGQPEGYLRYHTDGEFDGRRPNVTLDIDEMVAVTPGAYARLWRYCCEVDWVAHVKAHDRSTDEALAWSVADARHIAQKWRSDFLWVRLLDTPTALSARTYLAPGRAVLEVVDAHGFASGRFVLDGGPDGATCAPQPRIGRAHAVGRGARRRLPRQRLAADVGGRRSGHRPRRRCSRRRRRHVPRRRRALVHDVVLT